MSGIPEPPSGARRVTLGVAAASAQNSAQQQPQGAAFADRGGDAFIRKAGRTFILSFYGALRSLKLYPVENEAVKKALSELAGTAQDIIASEHDLELRVSSEFLFLNSTRLRLDLDNYASFSHLL